MYFVHFTMFIVQCTYIMSLLLFLHRKAFFFSRREIQYCFHLTNYFGLKIRKLLNVLSKKVFDLQAVLRIRSSFYRIRILLSVSKWHNFLKIKKKFWEKNVLFYFLTKFKHQWLTKFKIKNNLVKTVF